MKEKRAMESQKNNEVYMALQWNEAYISANKNITFNIFLQFVKLGNI